MIAGAGRRLREERERVGKSQRAIAAVADISKNTQLAYENETSPITLDYLARIESCGIDVDYVATGRQSVDHEAQRDGNADDLVDVAEIDLRFGLGAAFMDEQATPEMRSFSRAWLRQITTSAPAELYWARGRGDSMKPTIADGEIVLIDRSQQTPRDQDLIWAFAWGDIGAIKRLRLMPDGSIKILSDNDSVPPGTAVDGEVHIFGRVVAVVKKT